MDQPSNKQITASCEGKGILITGGGGYLAHSLLDILKDVECRVVRLGRSLERPTPPKGRARIDDLVGDVRERNVWESALEQIDVVFHFAGQTSVYAANRDAVADLNSNVMPMLHLLDVCRVKRSNPIVVFAGTVTEFGVPATIPVNESHPDHPVTIYDLHKLMAERYLVHFANQGVVRGVTLRLANVYGPGPPSSSADRGVLNTMVRRALAGQPITVYGDGKEMRDYIFTEDVAKAFLSCVSAIENMNGRYFVIGTGEGHTILEAMSLVAERVAFKTGIRAPLIHVAPPQPQSPIEARNFVADSNLFVKSTGWQARVRLAEGIDQTIEAAI